MVISMENRKLVSLVLLTTLLAASAAAATVTINVEDSQGDPVTDGVVTLTYDKSLSSDGTVKFSGVEEGTYETDVSAYGLTLSDTIQVDSYYSNPSKTFVFFPGFVDSSVSMSGFSGTFSEGDSVTFSAEVENPHSQSVDGNVRWYFVPESYSGERIEVASESNTIWSGGVAFESPSISYEQLVENNENIQGGESYRLEADLILSESGRTVEVDSQDEGTIEIAEERKMPSNLQLISPDKASETSTNPAFEFKADDPDYPRVSGEKLEYTLYVAEGSYSSFSELRSNYDYKKTFSDRTPGNKVSASPFSLDEGQKHTWGFRVKDEMPGYYVGSGVRTFTTKQGNRIPSTSSINLEGPWGEIEDTTPTFRFSASDPDGDDLYYKLYVREGDSQPVGKTSSTSYKLPEAYPSGDSVQVSSSNIPIDFHEEDYSWNIEVSDHPFSDSPGIRVSRNDYATFSIVSDSEPVSITDFGPEGEASSPVTLFVELNRDAAFSCFYSLGSSVEEDDAELEKEGSRYEAELDKNPGTYTYSMQCFEDSGDRKTEEVEVAFTVGETKEERPVAHFTWSPKDPRVNEQIEFDGSESYDPDSSIDQYRWDFNNDDKFQIEGKQQTFSFDSSGDKPVSLKVIDNEGNEDTLSRTVTVGEGDTGTCMVSAGSVRMEDFDDDGEPEFALNVYNDMDEDQEVRVRFYADGLKTTDKTRTVGSFDSYRFSDELSDSDDRDNDGEVELRATVYTYEEPCGEQRIAEREHTFAVGSDQEKFDLDVTVRDQDGDRLEDARVEVDNSDTFVRYTDSDGEAEFKLEPDNYGIEVSKSGYRDESRDIELDEDRNINIYLEKSDDLGHLKVLVEDQNGDRLEDAYIHVENSDSFSDFTNSNGRSDFFLEPDSYDVSVSKSGYFSRSRTVEIDADESETEIFHLRRRDGGEEGLTITDIDSPTSVCRGSTMTADVTIRNDGGFHEVVTVTGTGLGSINVGESFTMTEGDTRDYRLRFTNVQGSDLENFDITVTNHNSDSASGNVNVVSCPGTVDEDDAEDVTLELNPSSIRAGETVKASGFVDGVRGRAEVELDIDGARVAKANTQPDGYYQTFIRPQDVGDLEVTASTGTVSQSRRLEVLPTTSVTYAQGPDRVFQGESYRICGEVTSQKIPKVLLQKNGQIIASKNAKGDVCFKLEASEVGTHKFEIISLARGSRSSASTTVEILETDVETKSFPGKLAMVESGSGLVKVTLYNTNDELRRYQLDLGGVPATWFSTSEKEVILDVGERKEVFFYLTPEAEGEFDTKVSVSAGGSIIYEDTVEVSSGGTTDGQRGFWSRLLQSLGF